VERVDPKKIQEEEAYSPEEIYVRRLQRRPPGTAEEHRLLTDYLYDIGNWEDAQAEYGRAVAKDPLLEADLAQRLADLKDLMEDKAAGEVFQRAHRIAVLDGKWQEAIESIRAYAEANPGAKRRGFLVIEELEGKWLEKRRAVFHAVKNDELDRQVRNYLVKTQPDLATARSWVTSQLREQILKKVMERLGLSEEEAEMFLESKGRGAPHWATYGGGSFVIDRRAKTGKSTKRSVRGDPEAWWSRYCDVSTRSTWMKAYAAERLDIFEVLRVTTEDCPACGGTGQVKKASFTQVAGGKHEWSENCPRCFGARQERGVGYR
jgi:tetratricopeptide (TPR) repeat protein